MGGQPVETDLDLDPSTKCGVWVKLNLKVKLPTLARRLQIRYNCYRQE